MNPSMFPLATPIISVRPGHRPRDLFLEVEGGLPDTELNRDGPGDFESQLRFYARAIDAGCFGAVGSPAECRVLDAPDGLHRGQLRLPALPIAALRPLWQMTRLSYAQALTLTESTSAGEALVSRLDDELMATCGFPTELTPCRGKEIALVIELGSGSQSAALAAARPALDAWADLVSVGGFSGETDDVPSSGYITEVAPYLDDELTVIIEHASLGREAWAALANALVAVDAVAGIRRLALA